MRERVKWKLCAKNWNGITTNLLTLRQKYIATDTADMSRKIETTQIGENGTTWGEIVDPGPNLRRRFP
jgi:hypothetical protein